MPSQEAEIMITPKVCCDTKFPLINFAIKTILDLGLHLKLTITDKLFIFDRNHSLHCWKQTTLRSKTTWVSSQANPFSWQFKKEWHTCRKHVSPWNNSKKRFQFTCNMDSFYLSNHRSGQRFKSKNYLPVLSFEHLISFILKKFRHFPIRELFSRSSWGKRLG